MDVKDEVSDLIYSDDGDIENQLEHVERIWPVLERRWAEGPCPFNLAELKDAMQVIVRFFKNGKPDDDVNDVFINLSFFEGIEGTS